MNIDPTLNPRDYLPEPDQLCCWGAVNGTPCTCWLPIYGEQAEPDLSLRTLHARDEPCSSCAYRGGTEAHELLDAGELRPSDKLFLCHHGMRRVIGFRHEVSGQVVMLPSGVDLWNHDPLVTEDGRPWKADGTLADICRGWAKRTGRMSIEAPRAMR